MSKLSNELLKKHALISEQVEPAEVELIIERLEDALSRDVAGDVVEFGCYSGTTSLFIQRVLIACGSSKKLWVYDSFDGLPEKSNADESPLGNDFKRGELRSTKADFIHNFRKAQLPLPRITKKWFHEVEEHELPGSICLAFLDGDYYKSIRASLSLVLPKISPGGVVIIDDYDNPALPGTYRAVQDQGLKITEVKSSLGIAFL